MQQMCVTAGARGEIDSERKLPSSADEARKKTHLAIPGGVGVGGVSALLSPLIPRPPLADDNGWGG